MVLKTELESQMRMEDEMMTLIMKTATEDHRVRAVLLNGSRANPNAPRDCLQDYDIVYAVTETASFLNQTDWVSVFGKRIMMQEPDKMDAARGLIMDFSKSYSYLMLFTDGTRMDLRLLQKDFVQAEAAAESQTIVLLDKDGLLSDLPAASDRDFWITPPSPAAYAAAINEFWWCSQNVAKGLWRDELPYAKAMLDSVVRVPLNEMMQWRIGLDRGYMISTGKMGKYFKQKSLPEDWALYRQTYADGNIAETWDSLFTAAELFRKLATEVGEVYGFDYPEADDKGMSGYLNMVRKSWTAHQNP